MASTHEAAAGQQPQAWLSTTTLGTTTMQDYDQRSVLDKMSLHEHDEEKHAYSSSSSRASVASSRASLRKKALLAARQPRQRKLIMGLAILLALALLALSLCLGLGLGLTRRSAHIDDEPSSLISNTSYLPVQTWDKNASPRTRSYVWTLSEVRAAPAGVEKTVLVVNGISPGPMIEANLGDRLLVTVKNEMSNATAIHWHGQMQNGTNYMDGTAGITQCSIAPGATFTYNFTVQNVGSYWWHAHQAGQYSDGLVGAMLLHGPNEHLKKVALNAPANEQDANRTYHEDRVVLLADVWNDLSGAYLADYLSADGPPGGGQGDEPVPDCGLINGIGHCYGGKKRSNSMSVEKGKRYRFRVMNVGSLASFRFAIDGHSLLVVEADGTEVEPRRVQSITLSVGQRYSVIVEMNQKPAAYIMHGDLTDDMLPYEPDTIIKEQSLIMRYAGVPASKQPGKVPAISPDVPQDLDVATLVPVLPIDPPASTKQESFLISFGLTGQSEFRAFINETSWEHPDGFTLGNITDSLSSGIPYNGLNNDQLILTNDEPLTMDFIFNNEDDGDHPMHLHGYDPWILGTGEGRYQYGESLDLAGPFKNPMRRDVFTIPQYGWAVVRVTLNTPGLWTFHCHLSWHMAAGFLFQLSSMPGKIGPIPEANRALCNK